MTRHPITKHGRDHRPNGADPIGAIFFNYLNDSGASGYLDVTTHNYTSFLNDGAGGITLFDTGAGGIQMFSQSQLALFNTGGTLGVQINQSGGTGGTYISDSSSDGIYLSASGDAGTGGVISLSSRAGMTLYDVLGGIHIHATDIPSDFSSVTSNAIALLAGSHTQQGSIELATYDVNLHANYLWVGTVAFITSGLSFNGVTVQIQHSTQVFAVVDSGGFPIFRVDEGGSVHIRTGHSVVADL